MTGPSRAVRNKFKTPEGPYQLVAEKSNGLLIFNYQRCTRLTLAPLPDGPALDDRAGLWVIYSTGDVHLHIAHYDATHRDPVRSLVIGNSSQRIGFPCCHDFAPSKDGIDTLVGATDGHVYLLSLRSQLQAPPGSKPLIAATLTPDAANESAKCSSVLWLPGAQGLFMAAFSDGNIFIYKKASVVTESSSRFSLSIGSTSKAPSPSAAITLGTGINDAAVSPCGSFIAAACRDGTVKVVQVSSGVVAAGACSYYGAMLCCSFSPDGRYLAAGSEDDLVTVYSMNDRVPVVHCQGHSSWPSRVKFDPYLQLGCSAPSGLSVSNLPEEEAQIYRVASVGQDAQMCLWDVQVLLSAGERLAPAQGRAGSGQMRSSPSLQKLELTSRASGDLLAMMQQEQQRQPPPPASQRKQLAIKSNGRTIAPPPRFADMNVVQPLMEHRLHVEPISDVLFTERCIITADHTGCIRTWKRPDPGERLSRLSCDHG